MTLQKTTTGVFWPPKNESRWRFWSVPRLLALPVHYLSAMSTKSSDTKNGKKLATQIESFHSINDATTVVEYAIMLALIVLVCIAAIILVGGEAGAFWGNNADQMEQFVK